MSRDYVIKNPGAYIHGILIVIFCPYMIGNGNEQTYPKHAAQNEPRADVFADGCHAVIHFFFSIQKDYDDIQ